MRKKKLFFSLIFLLFIIGLLLFSVNGQDNHQKIPIEKDIVSLHSEWEFYWNQLLDPEAIKQEKNKLNYIKVPSSWEGKVIDGKPLSNVGYATYRLQVKIPKEDIGTNKALYLRYIGSAYQIWIDGEKKDVIGHVGKSIEEEIPKLRLNVIFFEPKQEIIEIVIQFSNHSFREGGIFGDVSYGDAKVLIPTILKGLLKDSFLIGGFFFIGLYHLIIFGMRKLELSIFIIGLMGMVGAVRTLLLSEYLLFLLVPHIEWTLMAKMEYLVEIAGFLLVIFLMKNMYPKEVKKLPLLSSYMFTILWSTFIVLTPAQVFTEHIFIHTAMMIIFLFYFVFYVGILAAYRKREGASINLVGLMIIMICICHDALYYTQIIESISLLEYSGLLFLLMQAVIISYRYAKLFRKNQTLTRELIAINGTLEQKVMERTKELKKKNEDLFYQATVDGLTGVFNRTYFLKKVTERLRSPKAGLTLFLIDLDDFKSINDRYGHIAGDHVLLAFSSLLKETYEDIGVVGRVGGEEFAVCVTKISEEEALHEAERLRILIESKKIYLHEEKRISITASIGIAYTTRYNIKFEDLYHTADLALYQSKKTGKNKATLGELVFR
ncbi:sensor domain-containing diguanylate cyclase [Bacillus taeanensis]|uniref:GGDEF domain-containing protein n=1 Tax=Bacillus taeanensis TaxID=273032 RepID=A0A366Y3V6_9BACI|nr:diguanylate cyclase [Bacillus taeanensis]RBW71093.1 hypothetical protein DS031_03620 [Bacillus taeanensis]